MRYNHVGIPVSEPRPGMQYLAAYRVWASDHKDNPYGIQFMHYEAGCGLPEIVMTRPHLGFVVDDLDAALAGQEILIPPNSPSEGVRVAFILTRGEPVELLQFDDPESPLA